MSWKPRSGRINSLLWKRVVEKPLFVEYTPDYFLSPLLEASAKSDYTLVLAFDFAVEEGGFAALSVALSETYETLQQTNTAAMPRLAIKSFVVESPTFNRLLEYGISALITRYPLFSISPEEDLANLVEVETLAMRHFLPVLFHANNLTGTANAADAMLRDLIGSGISGLIVPFEAVTEIKTAIRRLNFGECRAEVLRMVSEGESGT